MPVYSTYPEFGGRTLMSCSGAEPWQEITLSEGHPITGGEFTTYRLPMLVGHNKWGDPLFDMEEAEVYHEGLWYTKPQLYAMREREYERTGFPGVWRRKREPNEMDVGDGHSIVLPVAACQHEWTEAVDEDGELIEPAHDVCISCGERRD